MVARNRRSSDAGIRADLRHPDTRQSRPATTLCCATTYMASCGRAQKLATGLQLWSTASSGGKGLLRDTCGSCGESFRQPQGPDSAALFTMEIQTAACRGKRCVHAPEGLTVEWQARLGASSCRDPASWCKAQPQVCSPGVGVRTRSEARSSECSAGV